MHIHRNILAIMMAVMLIFGLISCREEAAGPLSTLEKAAQLEISGNCRGVDFSAVLTLGTRNESGGRDGELEFTAPEAMKGIRIVSAGGVWGAYLGEVEISGIGAGLLGAPLDAFLAQTEATGIEKRADGEAKTAVTVSLPGGTREYLIDSKSGYPLCVTERSAEGEIIMNYNIESYRIREE